MPRFRGFLERVKVSEHVCHLINGDFGNKLAPFAVKVYPADAGFVPRAEFFRERLAIDYAVLLAAAGGYAGALRRAVVRVIRRCRKGLTTHGAHRRVGFQSGTAFGVPFFAAAFIPLALPIAAPFLARDFSAVFAISLTTAVDNVLFSAHFATIYAAELALSAFLSALSVSFTSSLRCAVRAVA